MKNVQKTLFFGLRAIFFILVATWMTLNGLKHIISCIYKSYIKSLNFWNFKIATNFMPKNIKLYYLFSINIIETMFQIKGAGGP